MAMKVWRAVTAAVLLFAGQAPLSAQTEVKLLPAPPAPIRPPLTLPTANWVASGENNRCTASREYGSAAAPLLLGLRVKPMGTHISMLIVDGRRKTSEFEAAGVNVAGGSAIGSNIEFASLEANRRIAELPLKREDFERAVAQGELWAYSSSVNVRFRLSGIKALLAVVKACEVQVIADNGMSKADQARMAKKPEMLNSATGIFTTDDYPMRAIQKNSHGDVVARLEIDERGGVLGCKIIETSGSDPLDARTCSVAMKRAKFSPALDHQSKPMRSLFFYSLKWRLPS